jgi:hypothetical protein
MALPEPQPGLVIGYSYLWHHESLQGRVEGTKDRPSAIVVAHKTVQGDTEILAVPITHSEPDNPAEAIEIPEATRRRLGLSDGGRSWVILSELNRFIWPGPDLRQIQSDQDARYDYGLLPPEFFEQLKQQLLTLTRANHVATVKRT